LLEYLHATYHLLLYVSYTFDAYTETEFYKLECENVAQC